MHRERRGGGGGRAAALASCVAGTFGRVYLVRKRDDTSQRRTRKSHQRAQKAETQTPCSIAALQHCRLLAMKVLRKSRIGDSRLSALSASAASAALLRRRRAEYIITERKVLRSVTALAWRPWSTGPWCVSVSFAASCLLHRQIIPSWRG